jgi:hypothetical protein
MTTARDTLAARYCRDPSRTQQLVDRGYYMYPATPRAQTNVGKLVFSNPAEVEYDAQFCLTLIQYALWLESKAADRPQSYTI